MFRFGIAVLHRTVMFRRNVSFVQRKIPLISYFDLKYDQDGSISCVFLNYIFLDNNYISAVFIKQLQI
jgi:hypothetical protein